MTLFAGGLLGGPAGAAGLTWPGLGARPGTWPCSCRFIFGLGGKTWPEPWTTTSVKLLFRMGKSTAALPGKDLPNANNQKIVTALNKAFDFDFRFTSRVDLAALNNLSLYFRRIAEMPISFLK